MLGSKHIIVIIGYVWNDGPGSIHIGLALKTRQTIMHVTHIVSIIGKHNRCQLRMKNRRHFIESLKIVQRS